MESQFSLMRDVFLGNVEQDYLKTYPFFHSSGEDDFRLMLGSIEEWLKTQVDSLKIDEEKCLPTEVLEGMKNMGLFGLIIPEAFGGSELTQTLYTRIMELVNAHDSSVSLTIGAHSSIGLKGLYLYGSEEQKKKYMPRLATGELIAAFCLTEPTAGSDAAGVKTRVRKEGDTYVLNGSKLWITNGGFASFFTVFAKEEVDGKDKMTAFIVTKDMGGISHGPEERKLGMKASSTVEVFFKDVRIPAENVLGKPGDGFKIAMGVLNQGRLGLAGGSLGMMKNVFQMCLPYAKNRKAFGSSLSEFGLIQNMITQMACDTFAADCMTYFTTNLVDKGNVDYSLEAAMCKVFATDAAWRTVNTALQLHGGNGYMVEYGIERKLRDCRIGVIFEGTNEILRLFIALTGMKDLVDQYKKANKDLHGMKKFDSFLEKIGSLSGFALGEVKKAIVIEKLEGFHPSLEKESARLAGATQTLTTTASRLIRTYGQKLVDEQLQLARLADMAIDTYLIACVLSRLNTTLATQPEDCLEVQLGKLAIRNAKVRINQNSHDTKQNRDAEIKKIAQQFVERERYL